ncbi:MAG TPA: acetate kinase [Turneriella sp.]|nr:acetate kinase [Turneriella sp.]
MKILVINCGSATIKADVFTQEKGELQFSGKSLAENFSDYKEAILGIVADFERRGVLKAEELTAIGHRVVHGGLKFFEPVIIDDSVIQTIREYCIFAPLHNPANLAGIEYSMERFNVPQVAVFDTAFHQTMPPVATTYAIPPRLSQKYNIRRYGFHGPSHEYVTRECAKQMNIPYNEFNAISLHLGNGASICCVRNGKSIDTSMGFTPLEGLVMGSRSGDIDAGLLLFLQDAEKLTPKEMDTLLNKESGLKGLCGTNDMREIEKRATEGDASALLALQIFVERVRKYLGAYLMHGKPHAIIFTAGIGENSKIIREKICAGLEHLNLPPVVVVETDEEKVIAEAALKLTQS